MKQFYIPKLGEDFTLAKKWTFDLFHEHRNTTMLEHLGLECKGWVKNEESDSYEYASDTVSLPKGSKLKLDRIYIRKGAGEFDSVTFFLMGAKTTKRVEKRKGVTWRGNGIREEFEYEDVKHARPVRFWVKLDDANKLMFE